MTCSYLKTALASEQSPLAVRLPLALYELLIDNKRLQISAEYNIVVINYFLIILVGHIQLKIIQGVPSISKLKNYHKYTCRYVLRH